MHFKNQNVHLKSKIVQFNRVPEWLHLSTVYAQIA